MLLEECERHNCYHQGAVLPGLPSSTSRAMEPRQHPVKAHLRNGSRRNLVSRAGMLQCSGLSRPPDIPRRTVPLNCWADAVTGHAR
jgi:hypothetical protein